MARGDDCRVAELWRQLELTHVGDAFYRCRRSRDQEICAYRPPLMMEVTSLGLRLCGAMDFPSFKN